MVDKRENQTVCLSTLKGALQTVDTENKPKAAAIQNYPESRKTKSFSLLVLRPSFESWTVNVTNFTTM